MIIAHLADLHVRFGSRHQEYKDVFKSTVEDIKTQKPDWIIIAGDLYHQKVVLSSHAINILATFLFELSKIAPVGIIVGNHDKNLAQLDQGDSLKPIFDIVDLAYGEGNSIAHIVTEQNKEKIDFSKKAIYYFHDSGFYKVKSDLVFGVYSLNDGKILNLEKKEPAVNYVSLYHGALQGSKDDFGREMKGDELIKLSTFNNFDICLLGDIHSQQSFDRDEEMIIDEKELKKYQADGWEVVEYYE